MYFYSLHLFCFFFGICLSLSTVDLVMSITDSPEEKYNLGCADWEDDSIRYIQITRGGENVATEEEYISEPKLWKKEFEIAKRIKWKGLKRDSTVHATIPCLKESMMNKKGDIVNESNRKEYETRRLKQKLAMEICNILWNKLNYERQTAFDLFDPKCYVHFTKKEKSQFQKNVMSYFIAHATNSETLKERLFGEVIELEEKDETNLNELRRIANEHNLCLILHCEQENLLGEKKPMLITSKSFFFNIIGTIIRNESFEQINKGPSIVRLLLKLCEPSSSMEQQNPVSSINPKKQNQSILKNSSKVGKFKHPKNQNKISCSFKQYLEENSPKDLSKNYIREVNLQKEDYEIIERETLINDLIHKSILKITNKEKPNKEIWEELQEEILYKKKRKKKNALVASRTDLRDPIQLLKRFLEKDSNLLEYKDFLDELRSCTFQPNVHRYIQKEKNRRKNAQEKHNENSSNPNELPQQNGKDPGQSEGNDIFHHFNNTCKEIDNIKMDEYLNIFDTYYNNNTLLSKKGTASRLLDNPKHRTHRNQFRSANNINSNSVVVKMKKKPTQVHSKKNEWVNGLRGGYIRSHFNFSQADENEIQDEQKRKKNRLKQIDWGKKIRLTNRRLQTKVIPNIKLVKKLIEMDTSSHSYKEEPTTMLVRSKYTPSECDTSEKHLKKTNLIVKPNPLPLVDSSKEKVTKFLVPTPTKMHNYNRKIRIQNELKNFGELTTFAPPKIIAVESDTVLEDIRKELFALPDSVQMLRKYKNRTTN